MLDDNAKMGLNSKNVHLKNLKIVAELFFNPIRKCIYQNSLMHKKKVQSHCTPSSTLSDSEMTDSNVYNQNLL